MARAKKPENETVEQAEIRRILEKIANVPSRSEKTSWNRKMNNMVKHLATLRPIEDEILSLMERKQPIFDLIKALREVMVAECVHPYEYLLHKDDHIECKFCNKKIGLPRDAS